MDTTIDHALDRWHDADLLSDEQVAEIRAWERQRDDSGAASPAGAGTTDRPESDDGSVDRRPGTRSSGGTSLVAEGLAYVGAALVLGAGLALFSQLWDDFGPGARIGLSVVATLILGGGAWVLRDRSEDSLARLATVLSALTVVGVAATLGISLGELTEVDEEWIAVLAGLGALVVAVPVHLARESWPTTLAMGAALLTAVFGVLGILDILSGPLPAGITLMGLGLAWAVAGWSGMLRPRSAFEITGLVAGGIGVQFLAFEELTVLALLVGLAVSGGAMAVGLSEDRTSPAVLGGLGVTAFAPQLVLELFGETIGGPLALFVGGISLVTVAVTILRRKDVV